MRLTGPLLPPVVLLSLCRTRLFRLGEIEPIGVGNELVPIFEQPPALLLLFAMSTFVLSEAAKFGPQQQQQQQHYDSNHSGYCRGSNAHMQ